MLELLLENLPTLAVGAVVFGGVALACAKLYRDHKAGKGGCSCGGDCSKCKSCH